MILSCVKNDYQELYDSIKIKPMIISPGADMFKVQYCRQKVIQEGLKKYKVSNRRYRNRRIGDILKELHLTEGRNTGFGKILRALEENWFT